jgi:hypothetical protein
MKRKFSATGRDLHYDQLITNMLIGYRPRGMIADELFPSVPVMKQSDHYTIFSRADALRTENANRSPGKEANIITRDVSSDTYYAENYALKMAVTLEDKANADPVMMQKLINGRAQYIFNKLSLGWEQRVATQVTNTANVGSSAAVGSSWTDHSNSNPVQDIFTGMDNVEDSTGYRPNSIMLSGTSYRNLRRNDDLNNQILGTNNGDRNITRQMIQDFFEVERLVIGDAFVNNGNEAQAEDLNRVWADHALVYYAPMGSPSMDDPSFGYSFRWQGSGLPNLQAERHPYDSRKKSEEVEVGYYQDEVITGAEYGFLITNVTSST